MGITAAEMADIRSLTGLTIEQFGDLFQVSPSTVRRWEAGTSTPRQGVVNAIRALRGAHDDCADRLVSQVRAGSIVLVPTRCVGVSEGWWSAVVTRVQAREPFGVLVRYSVD